MNTDENITTIGTIAKSGIDITIDNVGTELKRLDELVAILFRLSHEVGGDRLVRFQVELINEPLSG